MAGRLCGAIVMVMALAGGTGTALAGEPIELDDGEVVLVKKGRGKQRGGGGGGGNMVVLRGQIAWIAAGAAGALVPLVLFALPCIWTASFGPFAAPFFVAALVWGTLMTAAGGGVAWLISALFSDYHSGLLIPVAVAAGIGLAGTFVSGLLAVIAFWPFFVFGAFWYGESPYSYRYWNRWYANPITGAGAVLAFALWSVGIITTSIAGPVVAAWLYRRLGAPRSGGGFKVELFTNDDSAIDLKSLAAGDSDSDDNGDRGGGGKGRSRGRSGSSERGSAPPGRPASSDDTNVGAMCAANNDCDYSCSKEEPFGAGMCTHGCENNKACPVKSVCIDVANGLCAVSCQSDADCRDFEQGFVCRPSELREGGERKICQAK